MVKKNKTKQNRTKPGGLFTFSHQIGKEEPPEEIVEKTTGKIRENLFSESHVEKVFQEGKVINCIACN